MATWKIRNKGHAQRHPLQPKAMDIDEVYKEIGEFGPYQKKIFWSLSLMQIYCAFHNIHNLYMGASPEFQCIRGKKKIDGCPADGLGCDSHEFSGKDFTSIVSEWKLVCNDEYKADLVQSVFMAGFLIGSFIFGTLADAHGRRKLIHLTAFGIAIFTLLGVTAPTYNVYIVLRFITGMCSAGFGMISFTYASEVVGQSKRGFLAMVFPVCFAIGIALYSLLAWLIRDWRYLTMATAVPGLTGLYFYITLPESPRWLFSQGRVAEAETTLEAIAQRNQGRMPVKAVQLRESSAEEAAGSSRQVQPGVLEVFRHPELRSRTLNNIFTWFVNCCVYYGLTIGAGSLGSSMYLSVALSGLIEVPAYCATWFIIDRAGRRPTFTWTMLGAGLVCVTIMLLPKDYPSLRTSLALTGKIGISVSFCVAWVYAAEMYPTNIRNKAMSVCNMSARLGGIFSPIILAVGKSHSSMDFLIFGTMTLAAGVLSMRLPETANMPMPETIDDLEVTSSTASRSPKDTDQDKLITEDKLRLLEGEIKSALDKST